MQWFDAIFKIFGRAVFKGRWGQMIVPLAANLGTYCMLFSSIIQDMVPKCSYSIHHSDLECLVTFVNSKMIKFQIFNFFLL